MQIVAVLHDVVEASEVTLYRLTQLGFPQEIVEAIDHLSRHAHETYEQFIERLRPNELAREVKLQDLSDNLDVTRLPVFATSDSSRLQRYLAALHRLRESSGE